MSQKVDPVSNLGNREADIKEIVVTLTIPLDNKYIGKQLYDGLIWKASSMTAWLKERIKDDYQKLQDLTDDGEPAAAEDSKIERIARTIELNEASVVELTAFHKAHCATFYKVFGEQPPSTLPREQRAGYKGSAASRVLEKLKAQKAAK